VQRWVLCGGGGVGEGVWRGGRAAAAALLRMYRISLPPSAVHGQAAANKNAKIVRIGVVNGHARKPCVQGDCIAHAVENRIFFKLMILLPIIKLYPKCCCCRSFFIAVAVLDTGTCCRSGSGDKEGCGQIRQVCQLAASELRAKIPSLGYEFLSPPLFHT